MKRILTVLLAALLVLSSAACGNGENTVNNEIFPKKTEMKTDGQLYTGGEVKFPAALWETPTAERYDALDREALNVEGYFIDSVQGTKVFAFVGLPEGASAENPVPGIVLVHGGGGTAFFEWVSFWVKRGYAAIAMDTDGNMPTENSRMTNSDHTASIREHGPANMGFADWQKPVEEQWAYYALSAVISSHSFLRSFDCVDQTKIGVTGISRGGYLAAAVTGFDDRFCFAVPVYGALGILEPWCNYGRVFSANERANELWNTTEIIRASRTPMLFVCGSNDTFIPLAAIARSAAAAKYGNILIIQGYPHSHAHGSDVEEIFVFADSICKGAAGLTHLAEEREGGFSFDLPSGVSLEDVTGWYVSAESVDCNSTWLPVSGDADGSLASAVFPESAAYTYVTVTDSRGYRITTPMKAL